MKLLIRLKVAYLMFQNKKNIRNLSEGNNPQICLFSKVEACQKINELMLESLENDKIELGCVDVVDESGTAAKIDKKRKKLEKLKDQPSKTE